MLAENTYDAQDRVSTQTSPFGRAVRFAYLPGRRTVVTDDGGGPRAEFEHDADGRRRGVAGGPIGLAVYPTTRTLGPEAERWAMARALAAGPLGPL